MRTITFQMRTRKRCPHEREEGGGIPDERGHQRPSEAIRGDQRRSEAIRGDQRRSEASRGHQRPSEGSSKAIRGVVEEAHRQTCLLEWHSRAQEDASGVAGLLEVIVRVAVGTILE
jgi:hypothetical protein